MNVRIPAIAWLRAYDHAWLRGDLVAGLTAAAVVVPQAMAYADIAGLPLAVGLYTALVPLVVYAVMGTSRPLSVTTTSTIAILTAGALHKLGPAVSDDVLVFCDGDAGVLGWRHSLDRGPPSARHCGEFHFGASSCRIQGRCGIGHRGGSVSETARE